MRVIAAAQTIPAPAQAASIVSTIRIVAARTMPEPTQVASIISPVRAAMAEPMPAPVQTASVQLLSGLKAVQLMAEPMLGAALFVAGSPTPQNPSGLALAWSDYYGDALWTERNGGLAAFGNGGYGGGSGMVLRLVTPPAAEPITVEEARAHLRVTNPIEDALIEGYLEAARETVEAETGRAIMPQTWEIILPRFRRSVELPFAPLIEVLEVAYRGLDGVETTLAASAYEVLAPSGPRCMPGRVVLPSGLTWPAVRGDDARAVRIRYRAGYEGSNPVPKSIRSAILLVLGELYEGREASVPTRGATAQSLSDNPAVRRLIGPLTIWNL